jgi:hypothetical protein
MTNKRILIFALACSLLFPVLTVSAAASRPRKYTTVYAHEFKPTEKYARGTLQGDFVWAAQSPNLQTAGSRWKKFLVTYEQQELDSAIQARLLTIAKFELMRVYYLLGNSKEGDRLMKELDPLKLLTAVTT